MSAVESYAPVLNRSSYINDSIVIFDVAKDLESAELPLSALRGIDRSHFEVAMDGRGLVVYEFDSTLMRVVSTVATGSHRARHTAML